MTSKPIPPPHLKIASNALILLAMVGVGGGLLLKEPSAAWAGIVAAFASVGLRVAASRRKKP